VQGGSWDGKRSKVLAFKKEKTSLYAEIFLLHTNSRDNGFYKVYFSD